MYHGWHVFDDPEGRRKWIKGLKAKYFGDGSTLGKTDFDWLLGPYSATGGDFPCVAFADELLAAYPEAKVVLVERDIDAWHRSMVELLDVTFNPINYYLLSFLDPAFMGEIEAFFGTAYFGFYNRSSKDEIFKVAKERYHQYYEHIRAVVPRERLLDFKLTQGWEPVCAFLGKDVPDQPFPWLNEKGEMRRKEGVYQRRSIRNMAINAGLVVGVLLVMRWI